MKGTVGSFFTFWDGPNWTKEGWNEIDFELVPSISTPVWTNLIWQNQQMVQAGVPNFQPATDWHEYRIEWTPSYVKWEIDGREVRKIKDTAAVKYLNKPCHLMMNFWTPTFAGWSDGFDDSTMPWYTRYDEVKVEKYNAVKRNFDFYWRDDFSSFNSARWFKSDGWTFPDNSSTFYPS